MSNHEPTKDNHFIKSSKSKEASCLPLLAYNLQKSVILKNLRKVIWQIIKRFQGCLFFVLFCFSAKLVLRTGVYYQGKPKCFRLTTVSTPLRVFCCFVLSSFLFWAESHVSSQRSWSLRDRTRLKYLQTLSIHYFKRNARHSPSLLNLITSSTVQMIKNSHLL